MLVQRWRFKISNFKFENEMIRFYQNIEKVAVLVVVKMPWSLV